ncbi:MAG TPA: hypothetical protein VF148_02830 [Acidimicrobiia bacterium]
MSRIRVNVVLAVVSMVLLAGLPAGAAVFDTESHCVVQVEGQTRSGELILADSVCFSSFQEAMVVASEGSISIEEAPSGEELFSNPEAGALLSFTLGTHFDGLNGSGSSISIVGSSCTGGYWNTGATWANRISSSWNGCYRLRHHDGPNKTGTYADTVGSGTRNLPSSMNNKAESVSYWSS